MTNASVSPPAKAHRERGVGVLWFAVLSGPLSWLLGLGVDYGLVQAACAGGAILPLHLVSVATLALALAGGLLALREWRRDRGSGAEGDGGRAARTRFMAAIGVMSSPLFALAIVVQWIALVVFHPCMGI